ncbi:MAG TPA: cell division protein FtsA [Candidatus Paceibacterota bacterium]|nr:cell division protein FtsA [Candidatus Paceibacterota bacterium]
MARRRIATGIDIGTHQTKIVVVEELRTQTGASVPRIIGTGLVPSAGMRHGYVVDPEDAAATVRAAKRQAEQAARVPIKTAFLSIGGISLDEARATGACVVSRADQEITELDIEKVLDSARMSAEPHFLNRRVLHEIPLQYRVDGHKVLGDPVGLRGTRLEADYLFITCLESHASALIAVAEAADIDIIDCMASPLAGSYVTLTKDQKMKGCVLANIGAETLSIVVYDENVPISMKVFPAGGSTITDELALGFRVSLEDAERIKMGRLGGAMYPKKKVDDIITGRFRHMFDLIDKHLRALGKRGNLPAGIIISGGASGQGQVTDIAKGSLALPSKIADMQTPPDAKIKDATWAVAFGLALWGLTGDTDTPKKNHFAGTGKSLRRFLQQFLP